MKKKLWIAIWSTCSFSYAQVGVNTMDITSTLTVQGSVSANYREINKSNYNIQQDDYNVSYHSNVNDGVFNLPDIRKDGGAFGRIYNIKNASSTKLLTLKTLSNQSLRFGGDYPNNVNEFTIQPGQYLYLTATKELYWDVYHYTDTYGKKTTKIDDYLSDTSVVRLGNFSARIERKPNTVGQDKIHLQCMLHQLDDTYIVSHTIVASPNAITQRDYNDFKKAKANTWEYVYAEGRVSVVPNLDVNKTQMLVSHVTVLSSSETYRITCTVFSQTFIAGGRVILKLEKLP
ncbi:hypothetical protein [Myroides fluvii]|uniref:hypothetical protein n=1 Tax=Myroides fluvii TaxID=2572594 RepID=UPI00131D74C6|nr:hypothetical protein [Myroides fluvii]